MRHPLLPIALLVLWTAALLPASQTPPAPPPQTAVAATAFADAIARGRAQLEPALRRHPALAVAVAVGDELVWSEAYGWADVERRVAATPATRFRIYSVVKPMTAVIALRLAEAGRVRLEAPIGTYLPGLPADTARATTNELLTHTAGVHHYRAGEWMRVSRTPCARAADALPSFINDKLLFAPGTRVEYSSFGYVLASAVLESVVKKPFAALAADELLAPLEMRNTVPDDPTRPDANAATPYESEGRLRVSTGIDNTCKVGAGGFRASAEDVARFGLALLQGTRLPAGALDRLATPAAVKEGVNATMGFGVGITSADGLGKVLVQSGGAIGGRALLLVAPERRIVVALAVNVEGQNLGAEAGAVARAFLAPK